MTSYTSKDQGNCDFSVHDPFNNINKFGNPSENPTFSFTLSFSFVVWYSTQECINWIQCRIRSNVWRVMLNSYRLMELKLLLKVWLRRPCTQRTSSRQYPLKSISTLSIFVSLNFNNHVFLFRALVNAYKLNPSPGILKVGITAFYKIVSFVCEDTQRHPPTRQFFTSCIEILGQVLFSIQWTIFISKCNDTF